MYKDKKVHDRYKDSSIVQLTQPKVAYFALYFHYGLQKIPGD